MAANWGALTLPTGSDTAFIINGGTADITLSGEACNYLYLGYPNSTNSGTIQMSGGNLAVQSSEYLGNEGTGTFRQSGGTNNLSGSGALWLGYFPGSSGGYNLSGSGLLSATKQYVGYYGMGTFAQSGGANNLGGSGVLWLGYFSGSRGSYNLSGSGLLGNGFECVGESGTGTFTQSGGTNNPGSNGLTLGDNTASSGVYNLGGSGLLVAGGEQLGFYGSGTFTQTGGTNNISGALSLSAEPGSSGTYNLSGSGQLSAYQENLGVLGTATFIQSGGTNSVAGGGLTLGSSGTYNLTGGVLLMPGFAPGIARYGGVFNLGGGTLMANNNFSTSEQTLSLTGSGGNGNINTGGYSVAFSTVLSGPGGLNKGGAGVLMLTAGNTYTGGTTISAGTLNLDFAYSGAPTANIINNATKSSNLTLAGGILAIQGRTGTTNSQRFNGLVVNPGCSAIVLTAGTSNPLLLSLGGITRNAVGGTVDFTLPSGTQSASNGITTTTPNTNGILGAYATVGESNWACTTGAAGNITAYSAYTGGDLGARFRPHPQRLAYRHSKHCCFRGIVQHAKPERYCGGHDDRRGLADADGWRPDREHVRCHQWRHIGRIGWRGTDHSYAGQPHDKQRHRRQRWGHGTGQGRLSHADPYRQQHLQWHDDGRAGTLQLGNGGTSGSLSGNVSNNAWLVFNRSDNPTFGGVISGAGSLIQAGTGVLTLAGSNGYSGGTTVASGAIALNNANAVLNSTVTVSTNNGLLFTTDSGAIAAFNVGGLSGNGSVNLADGSYALTLSAGGDEFPTTYSGALSGAGGLAKAGNGGLLLTGSNTYTGGTTISAGTLQLGNGGTSGSLSGNVSNNAWLVFNRSDNPTFGGVISGAGSLIQAGTGVLTLTGSNGYSGGTTVASGAIALNNANAVLNSTVTVSTNNGLLFTTDSGAIAAFNVGGLSGNGSVNLADGSYALTLSAGGDGFPTTYSGALSGAGGLAKAGNGVLLLTGSNTYTGGTTVSAGTLQLGNGGSGASIGSTSGVANNASLIFNHGDRVSLSAVISGSGSLTQTGSGMLSLVNSNSYTGQTTITSGTLQIGNGATDGSIANSSGIIDNATLAYNLIGSQNYGNVISGSGGLYKTGGGTLTLTGSNIFNGPTIINGGSLIGSTASLPSAVSLANNANVTFSQTASGAFLNTISGSGGLTAHGPGILILTGSNSYTNGTTIAGGAVEITNNSALGSGAVTLAGGTLSLAMPTSIGVHFVGNGGPVTGLAGAVPMSNWNNLSGASFSNVALTDAFGNASSATLSTSGVLGSYASGSSNQLLNGYIFSGDSKSPIVAALNGIPYASYSLYAYMADSTSGYGEMVTLGGTTYYYSPTQGANYTQVTNTTAGVYPTGDYAVATGLSGGSQMVAVQGVTTVFESMCGLEIVNSAPLIMANAVTVSANSTIDVTGPSSSSFAGLLTMGGNRLSLTGGGSGANTAYSLTLGSSGGVLLTGNPIFDVADNGSGVGTLILAL